MCANGHMHVMYIHVYMYESCEILRVRVIKSDVSVKIRFRVARSHHLITVSYVPFSLG
jgi:hypothetical protein